MKESRLAGSSLDGRERLALYRELDEWLDGGKEGSVYDPNFWIDKMVKEKTEWSEFAQSKGNKKRSEKLKKVFIELLHEIIDTVCPTTVRRALEGKVKKKELEIIKLKEQLKDQEERIAILRYDITKQVQVVTWRDIFKIKLGV